MAIKMVREPSETPNIKNIDDIIPMRYAYGNQNGYVIGKGSELSNTIVDNNFTINSGRIVLQGVECDIDASGVVITIDAISQLRYYAVYLQVNLSTNTAIIKTSYDTTAYPTVDSGDDLTQNSSGIANLMLYTFIAQNGTISEVNKKVLPIKYSTLFKQIYYTEDNDNWGQFTTPEYDFPAEMELGYSYKIDFTDGTTKFIHTDNSTTTYDIYLSKNMYMTDRSYVLLFGSYSFDFTTRKITCPYKRLLRFAYNTSWDISAGVMYIAKIKAIYKVIE